MRFKKAILACGLNFKIEIILLLFVNTSFFALLIYFFFFLSNVVYVGVVLLFVALYNALNIFRFYLNKKHLEENEIKDLLFLFKKIYVELNQNNNVLNSLNICKESSSLKMNGLLDDLISEINTENSVQPYLKFAHYFKNIQIEQLMIKLHFYSVNNDPKYLDEFNVLYLKLLDKHEIDAKKKIATSFSLIKSSPIFALIVIILITIISIALIIGKDINV